MVHSTSSLGDGNPAFAQAFGIPRPPKIFFAIVSGYFEGLQILLERNQGVFARGIIPADLGRARNRTFEFKNLEHCQLSYRAYPIRRSGPRFGSILRKRCPLKFGCGQ
jgi:hypothetical protein